MIGLETLCNQPGKFAASQYQQIGFSDECMGMCGV